jgi:hypothetical protein
MNEHPNVILRPERPKDLRSFASLRMTAVLVLFLIVSAGCGKKEAPLPAAEETAAAPAAGELPELEQNKLYMNNPLVPAEQDTSFEPVPDEQEPLSQEELDLLGPPAD